MAKMPLAEHDNVVKTLPDRTAGACRRNTLLLLLSPFKSGES
jgi:hypothetical protein